MRLEDTHTKKHKKTCKYVSLYLPIFDRYIPARFKKYLTHAGDETWAKRGVKTGAGPSLLIRKTETVPGHPYTSNGFFWSVFPDNIFLEERNAKKFEANPGKYEICLQYLLLHELIHWVRHHAGLDADLAGGAEAGDAWEAAAYGRDMSRFWDTGAASCDRSNIRL